MSPTPLSIVLMLAGVPGFVAVALVAPALWPLAGAWLTIVLGGMGLDAMLSARLLALRWWFEPPGAVGVGTDTALPVEIRFDSGPLPARIDAQLETGERFSQPPVHVVRGFQGRERRIDFRPVALRRGEGEIVALWLRWSGPFGLVSKQTRQPVGRTIAITPDLAGVVAQAVRLHDRHADLGEKVQLERGAGSEFEALREFAAGMDRRAIDWKHSARHRALLAKEFRTERNHTLVMAFDTGRLMSEPLDGLSRLDRAIHAGLLLAHVSLRAGDKVALYGFDARPRLPARVMSGTRAFPHLQALASRLDYSAEEANYTLGLAELASTLNRRALVVLFTDFVDTVSAEIMGDSVARLSKRHHVLFATFRDPLLTGLAENEPQDATDVGRAVIAHTLLAERERVFARLSRLGVDVLEAEAGAFGTGLINRYLDIKRRESL